MAFNFRRRRRVTEAMKRAALSKRVKKERAKTKAYTEFMKDTMKFAKDYDFGDDKDEKKIQAEEE